MEITLASERSVVPRATTTSRPPERAPAPIATTKLLIGPTTDVRMSSSTGFLKFRGSTGVGLAQPITGSVREHRNRWQQQRPEQVNVLDGIERNPPQHARSWVAAQIGHPGVRRFVDADREHERDQLKNYVDVSQGHSRLASILTCEALIPRGLGRCGAVHGGGQIRAASAFPGTSATLPARSTSS